MDEMLREEFIGKSVKIVQSTNHQLVGLTGTIVDETKHTFKILVGSSPKIKTLLKNGTTFSINASIIDGKKISRRGEDRIKIKD